MKTKKGEYVDEAKHLHYFKCCFYSVFSIANFNCVGFTFPELFDYVLVKFLLCNSFRVGFSPVGFAVELECYPFAFNQFTIDFKPCF